MKKFLSVLLSLCIVLALLPATVLASNTPTEANPAESLTAAPEKDGEGESTTPTEDAAVTLHSLTYVPAKEATCTEAGNMEHWVCSDCGKMFADAQGTKELTNVTVPAKQHTLVYVPQIPATSEHDGIVDYWKCSACGKLFWDEYGRVPVAEEDIPVFGKVVSGNAVVEAPVINPEATQAQKDAMQQAYEAVKASGGVKESGLSKPLSIKFDTDTWGLVVSGVKDKATDKNEVFVSADTLDQVFIDNNFDNANELMFVAESFLKVQITDAAAAAKADGTVKTSQVSFDITPYANLKVITDVGEALIDTFPMAITDEPVTITLTLPDNFEVSAGEKVKVEHVAENGTKYCYDAVVDNNNKITFENPHGFSTFTVMAVSSDTTTPTTPVTPTTPTPPATPNAPATGDSSTVALYVGLLAVSLLGTAMVIGYKRSCKGKRAQ